MTHKVHPKIFRLKGIDDWVSRGFYDANFSGYLKEDFNIREFLKKKLGGIGIEKIEIERFPEELNIILFSARPGLIIGRGGEGVERLRKELQNILSISKKKKKFKLEIKEVKEFWSSASLSAQWIAQQIEKRVFWRRALSQALDKIMFCKIVKGAKVEVAGRLDGVEISRSQKFQKGQLPLQTIKANIEYGAAEAYCSYGVVGVKVWIYKGKN